MYQGVIRTHTVIEIGKHKVKLNKILFINTEHRKQKRATRPSLNSYGKLRFMHIEFHLNMIKHILIICVV
jgi:hypothetical protein